MKSELKSVLDRADMYADPIEGSTVGLIRTVLTIRDEEGTFRFTVGNDVNPNDLSSLLIFARREYERGRRDGLADAQRNMRQVLGVPEMRFES